MRRVLYHARRALAAIVIAGAAFAAPSKVSVQTTSTQAVLSFTVTDPSQCQVQIYSDTSQTQLADDSNPALFPGSQQCNRAGSAIAGTNITFVAGLRTSQKATDGKLHSRALAAERTYYYVITDAVDSQPARGSFTTATMPLGNLYPEQPPFDPAAWDNRAYPQFDWTVSQRNQALVDPLTGQVVKRVTFAGDAYARSQNSTDGVGAPLATGVVSAGACSNSGNLNSSGSSYARCTGAAKIFVPLPAFQMPGAGVFRNWYPRFNVDDLLLYAYGSADAAAIGAANGSDRLSVCIAQGAGLPCLSRSFAVTLQASAGATGTVKVPANAAAPVFANWGFTPLHGDVVPTPGTVSVTGNMVALTNPAQANTAASAFNVDWPAGSQIFIQGSSAWGCANDYCSIASIQSAVQLTTVETCNAACPASANYEGRAFGFQITRQGAAGSVSVSFGFEAGMSTSWSVLEDGTPQHCNSNPVTVTNDAAGNPYPGYALRGYVCTFTHEWAGTAFWLFISRDQNNAPLGESRPLGEAGLPFTVSWSSNGASFPNGAPMSFAGWHPSDGSAFMASASYNSGATALLVSARYDSTRPGCNPPYMNWTGAQNYVTAYSFSRPSCFTYTNLTNPSATPPMDLRSQIVRAYAAYNPGFDLSGFVTGEVTVVGGYARTCLGATGGGDRSLRVCAAFDVTTGNLVQIFDSFSKYPGRWGYVHGPIHAMGKYHSLTLDQPYPSSASGSNTLYGPFEMAVTAVNRAGSGQAPNWTLAGTGQGTSMAAGEAYACPTGLAQYLVGLGAAGNHCIQVKVSSEPCSHTPGTAAIYPGGKTEAQQFPCTSADGATVTNAVWSKLQNLAVGDWVRPNENYNDYDEVFIVAGKDVISANEINLWLVRGGGVWPNNAQPAYGTINAAHPDGLSLAPTANWIVAAANWMMDATDPSAAWLPDNPALVLVHGVQTAGSNPDNKIAVAVDLQDQSKYAGFYDSPVVQQIMQPLPDIGAVNPAWAGSGAGYAGFIQQYMNNDQAAASAWDRRWVVNYRHLNPSTGNGPEYRSSPGVAGTLAPVSGTNQVYKISDPYSGGAADPKQLPFTLFAGRFLLQDISSPDTSRNTITDTTSFAACFAIHTGECRMDSSAGDRYVSVPFAPGESQCLTNQYEEAAPCFFNASPIAGKIQQLDVSGPFDAAGLSQRMLSSAFTGIGGQYQFSAPKLSPDGAWMFVPCWWLNGVRSEVCAVSMPSFPARDSIARSGYVPYDIALSGSPGDQVRICWGYAENGPVDGSPASLYPAPRQERGCSIGAVPAGLPSHATSAGNAASFVNTDTATGGNWESLYGSDGYNVIQDSTVYPSFVTVGAGGTPYVWATQTSDVRGLQKISSSGRIAACLYSSTSFTIDLRFTDGAQHKVAFYFVDWDYGNRSETAQILNGDTGAILDTRSITNFSNGVYLTWSFSGHVTLKLTDVSGVNAVLSGIFMGSGPPGGAVAGPFGWASDPVKYADCSAGCQVRMNLIAGRVAYYIIERNNGGQITTSPVMIAVQP
ncbi:MAG TPA: hypothetical protein VEV17_15245 [Bryobacteraceae bacterium]|nr:hypothetical protein [Bryobacteraceae bacterium]